MLTTTSANPQTVAEPFPDLVDESLDEAAFLWRRWETELTSLTRSLDEIYSWTEDRLHGALDGVRVGGPRAVEVATKELGSEDMDRIAVGTAMLGSITEPGAPEAIAAALKTAEGKKLDGDAARARAARDPIRRCARRRRCSPRQARHARARCAD